MPPKRLPAHLNMTATASYHTAEGDVEMLDVGSCGWAVVEAKFQELRALLSAPTTGLNASQARDDQKRAVSAAITRLLDRSQAECRRLLVNGNAKAAVEGGLKTLKLKEEYYGPGSLQLVPAYFHLARTNQFMDKFKRAEEFLSLAQYEVLRHPDADISLHAELHQTFGLLYASDGKLDAALKQLTCSTYYLSCMHGPENILTSFGYFDIGNVFAAKSHMEHAMAFYDRVKKIWDTYLTAALQKALDADGDGGETPATLGDENVQDAAKMLRGIVGLQTERYGQIHPAPAYGEHVLGMFLLWSGDSAGGFETLLRALEIYKRVVGERHPKCQGIRLLLVNHGFQVPEDTADALADDGAAAASSQQQQQQQQQPAGGVDDIDDTPAPAPAAPVAAAPEQPAAEAAGAPTAAADEAPAAEEPAATASEQSPAAADEAQAAAAPTADDMVATAPLGDEAPAAASGAGDDEAATDAAPAAAEAIAAPADESATDAAPAAADEAAADAPPADEAADEAAATDTPPADATAPADVAPAESADAAPDAGPDDGAADAAPSASPATEGAPTDAAPEAVAPAAAEAAAEADQPPATEGDAAVAASAETGDGAAVAEAEAPPAEMAADAQPL